MTKNDKKSSDEDNCDEETAPPAQTAPTNAPTSASKYFTYSLFLIFLTLIF